MKTAFLLETDHQHFVQHGYVTFPFLSPEELEAIRKIYHEANVGNRLHQQQFYGVNYSLGTLTPEENNKIMYPVLNILKNRSQERFNDFEILGCVFITKPPKTPIIFVYHQDWSYTNEKEHAFATCWVPLYDTNTKNGCMSVVEGSHQLFETYRSDTLDSARIDFDSIPQEIRTDIEQKAGSCLAFHQAVFHGSYPNVSEKSRPVLAFVVKHIESPVIHYVKEPSGISAYRLSVDAFNKMLTKIPKSSIPESAIKTETITISDDLPTARTLIASWRTDNALHRLLKIEEFHRKFQRDGFLLLKNVIAPEVVAQLRHLYDTNFVTQKGMYVTHHYETDLNRNKNISNSIFSMIDIFLKQEFINYRHLISHFTVKSPGTEGLFNLHQDWSIVREELFGVIHCWVPLQKVSKQNGTLAVLPGSHLCFHNYRSGTCSIRFLPINAFEDKVIHLEAEPGDVVLYHPALFHGSGKNNSTIPRIAVVAAIAHSESKNVYFHAEGDQKVTMYELTEIDLFSRLNELSHGQKPLGQIMQSVEPRTINLTDSELEECIKRFYQTQ